MILRVSRLQRLNSNSIQITKGAVTDKSSSKTKKYTQFHKEEGVFFGIIYV